MKVHLPHIGKTHLLRQIAYQSLLDLATEDGINASGKDEIYGCTFGRDTAITVLKTLKVLSKDPDSQLSQICRRALINLIHLQGKEVNIESGEQPGKILHEYRKGKYEHLIQLGNEKPWYVYPDKTLKSYDSLDSTPLTLIAIYRYWQLHKQTDKEFLITVLPSVEAGLNWIITYGDLDKDFLLEYELPEERQHGGLRVQSWTDSTESLLQVDGSFPKYPIAPVEVQGYGWLALKLWGDFYLDHSPQFGQKLLSQALEMKKRFNQSFIIKDEGHFYAAQALDGYKNQIKTITGNPLLLLWATYQKDGQNECILDQHYISSFVSRAFLKDMFDDEGGIRTMSTNSKTFDPSPNSYHNGSFWPVLNGMIYEGLKDWGFNKHASQLAKASLTPLRFFNSPIELYTKGGKGEFFVYSNAQGQKSCMVQAWSAAAMLDMLTDEKNGLKILTVLKRIYPHKLMTNLHPVRFLLGS